VTDATTAAARDDRAFFGHPRCLGLLFIAEMWERFSYYGMRALLVLYLVNAVGWKDADAYRLYGTYTGMVWLTPMIGGFLADRYLGTHRALLFGGAIIAAGHFVLALPGMGPFYLGLILVVLGTGLFKPNASTMVGQLYEPGDRRRDAGFTIFYMGINLGGTLGPIVCGNLRKDVGWHAGFAAAGVGMVIGLLVYAAARKKYLGTIGDAPSAARPAGEAAAAEGAIKPWHGIVGALVGGALGWATGNGDWAATLTGVITGAAIATAILSSHGEERRRVVALCLIVAFVTVFWVAYEQAGSSMNVFADRHTDLTAFGSVHTPEWFQTIQPGSLLLLAPVMAAVWQFLAARGKEPSTALKVALGLIVIGLGFLCMVSAGKAVDGGAKVSGYFLVATYVISEVGELMVSPVGLSYVTKVAPARLGALMMGVFFLSNSAANKIAGMLAEVSASMTSQASFYMISVATSIGAGLLLLLLVPWLKKMTAGVAA
jgi:POT family proton-dependent oligopeptide transporter